jgi:hypothetical protein
MKTGRPVIDLRSQTFGNWRVLDYVGNTKWRCLCLSCGEESVLFGGNLRGGLTAGCKQCQIKRITTHGHTVNGQTPTYRAWHGMKQRCENPNSEVFKDYGGRGIMICQRWDVFENFLEDMGPCPVGLEIDRIDNNGNYEPGNCRWTTKKQNQSNKRNNRFVLYGGRKMTFTEMARLTGRGSGSLFNLLKKYNWPEIDFVILPKPCPKGFLKQYSK